MTDDATTEIEKSGERYWKGEEKIERKESALFIEGKDKSAPEEQLKAKEIAIEMVSKEDIEISEKETIVEDVHLKIGLRKKQCRISVANSKESVKVHDVKLLF